MTPGPVTFARFAYPPNALGYCGPDDAPTLLDYVAAGSSDPGLVQLARGFEGAWPYLELIAASAHIADPLDARVVEAYWVGNRLLDRVPAALLGASLEDRFRGRTGRHWAALADLAAAGAPPHHNTHVFGVYPWVGALRGGVLGEPLRVLDQCRVRWGTVVELGEVGATVRYRPLVWTGALALGQPVLADVAHRGLTPGLAVGDVVAMHWGWVCDRLDQRRLRRLQHYTARALQVVNATPSAASAVGG